MHRTSWAILVVFGIVLVGAAQEPVPCTAGHADHYLPYPDFDPSSRLRSPTIASLTHLADVAILGTVKSLRAAVQPYHNLRQVYTTVTLSVEAVYKGAKRLPAPTGQIQLRELGGTAVDPATHLCTEEPGIGQDLQPGGRYIFFLRVEPESKRLEPLLFETLFAVTRDGQIHVKGMRYRGNLDFRERSLEDFSGRVRAAAAAEVH